MKAVEQIANTRKKLKDALLETTVMSKEEAKKTIGEALSSLDINRVVEIGWKTIKETISSMSKKALSTLRKTCEKLAFYLKKLKLAENINEGVGEVFQEINRFGHKTVGWLVSAFVSAAALCLTGAITGNTLLYAINVVAVGSSVGAAVILGGGAVLLFAWLSKIIIFKLLPELAKILSDGNINDQEAYG
jgi:hypothetical protein